MAVEYDLIIVGASGAGVAAAQQAAQWQARVALVTQNTTPTPLALTGQRLWQHAASQSAATTAGTWVHLSTQAQEIATSLAQTTLERVAVAGVDVIAGRAQFQPGKTPTVQVGERQVRSRTALLTLPEVPLRPPFPDLATVPYQTVAEFWQRPTLPHHVAILGGYPAGVALAQCLASLGVQVTLLTTGPQVLPQADPHLGQLLQHHLTAAGVVVLTQAIPQAIRQKAGQIELLLAGQVIAADVLVWAGRPTPDVGELNLAIAGVSRTDRGLWTNEYQQTTNPRIYGAQTAAEAAIAVKNALFLPWWRDRSQSPTIVHTHPAVAWVGLSARAATQRYGHDVICATVPTAPTLNAQITGDLTGVYQLVTRRNGTILGGQGIGQTAADWVGTVALAMQQRLRVPQLHQLPAPLTSTDLLRDLAHTWQQQRQTQTHWRQETLLEFFSWRRS